MRQVLKTYDLVLKSEGTCVYRKWVGNSKKGIFVFGIKRELA